VSFLGFLVASVVTGYLLYRQPTRRAVIVAGLYSIAALVAVIPVVYQLRLAVTVQDPLRHLVSTTDLLLVVGFWVVAAVPALIGYRLDRGPILARRLG
jgi:biotin transporter BioY